MVNPETCRFGVLTASDRASKGEYDDLSGPAIEGFLEEALTSDWEVERRLVEDERESIEAALIDLIDNLGCSVVVTTGGSWLSTRISWEPASLPDLRGRMRRMQLWG